MADIRVAINDPASDDFEGLNVVITPDAWTYKAAIADGPRNCELSVEPGNALFAAVVKKSGKETITATNAFGAVDVHDSLGNIFSAVAHENGYRLVCGVLPSHLTVHIVFACVNIAKWATEHMKVPPPKKPGDWGFWAGEFKGEHPFTSINPLDWFGPRPSPSAVKIDGGYKYKSCAYHVSKVVKIDVGK